MNNKFIELIPIKYGKPKQPVLINLDSIQTVIKYDDYLSEIILSDCIKYQLKEFITLDILMYVVYPKYEDIVLILTNQKESKPVGEINNGRTN